MEQEEPAEGAKREIIYMDKEGTPKNTPRLMFEYLTEEETGE
jgi:hypothetical protein